MTQFAFEKTTFSTALRLQRKSSRRWRKVLAMMSMVGGGLALTAVIYSWVQTQLSGLPFSLPALPLMGETLRGFFLFFLTVRLTVFAVDRFVESTTYDKHGDITSDNLAEHFNYFAAQLWFYGVSVHGVFSWISFLSALLETDTGTTLLIRLGIIPEEYKAFLLQHTTTTQPTLEEFSVSLAALPANRDITLGDLVGLIATHDKQFHELLVSKQVDEHVIQSTAQWVEQGIDHHDQERRWWSRERLGRIPGIAKTWAYGPVYTLLQFAATVQSHLAPLPPLTLIRFDSELQILESALLKNISANVVVVGEPGTGKATLVYALEQMILQGRVFPELESKRIFTLNGPALISAGKTQGEIESILLKIFTEAVYAGDVILVIPQFPEFIESLKTVGIAVTHVLAPYLASSQLHLVALADTTSFRTVMENDTELMTHFTKVEIVEPTEDTLVSILQDTVPYLEAQARGAVILTYPALKKIAEAGTRYLVTGALPERALDLAGELINYSVSKNIVMVTPDVVADYVGVKTKVPLGEITQPEQEKLMHLEDLLHQRIVGQTEAVDAIANTIRRARTGIGEPKRPIGSFLFLGPTGVGKTETAKALADFYFGGEDVLMRFDMTEYQGDDGLEHLIGSSEKKDPGILGSRIRSSPYGVLLFDEFEKAHKKVVDLFLQILDEGMFTDAFGQHVNMRNTIIIATSNAGASLIQKMVQAGIQPGTKKTEILNQIQQEGLFRPELLNRFDATIMFQPLSPEQLRQVAILMFIQLAGRLKKQQNITFKITDALVAVAVSRGYDPAFGARPLRRFIQDTVEKAIAEKIITHKLSQGGSITLDAQDIAHDG